MADGVVVRRTGWNRWSIEVVGFWAKGRIVGEGRWTRVRSVRRVREEMRGGIFGFLCLLAGVRRAGIWDEAEVDREFAIGGGQVT